jgi:lipopolysaccharide transport system ATP-binding protein
MNDTAIKITNLSKRYRLGLKEKTHDTFSGKIFSVLKSPFSNFRNLQNLSSFSDEDSEDVLWALKDVSFEIKKGEVLGVIGSNGAGKSTLLKIITQITNPTYGEIVLNGRVASLLEVGTGFHPDLTGRENIYLNGTILGMTKNEIDKNFDDIVNFSGIEKFIDTPIKRYSSGMSVRLAFSVAAFLEPEILLIDEVLAVGDIKFQKKCLGKMEDISSKGRTILFVSHNISAIKNLCNRGLLLENGRLKYFGNIETAIKKYHDGNEKTMKDQVILTDLKRHSSFYDGKKLRFNKILLENKNSKENTIYLENEIKLKIEFTCSEEIKNYYIGILVFNMENIRIFDSLSIDKNQLYSSKKGQYFITCTIPENTFLPGLYRIEPISRSEEKPLDYLKDAFLFRVNRKNIIENFGGSYEESGIIKVNNKWTHPVIGND